MQFLIANTFTESLSRLTGDEQRHAKTTAMDLQLNPQSPGLSFHKLDRARDKRFWSVRVNADIRIIVHRSDSAMLLCYVDHHDPAYRWAEGRKLETHPTTGAAQFVEVRETKREIVVPTYVSAPDRPVRNTRLAGRSDDELLGYGVPTQWLPEVKAAGTDDELLDVCSHLPAEAAEAVMELWAGRTPKVPEPLPAGADPFVHPDAQRRFRVLTNREELEQALDAPWEKWVVFLHPEQRQWVDRTFSGPARVTGTAGTGKTIVALHRAVHLARRDPAARVLLTTFSDTLANALLGKLRCLAGREPRVMERIEVAALDTLARRMHRAGTIATEADVRGIVEAAARSVSGHRYRLSFLLSEWEQVVDAWQLDTWEAYRDVARLGRKTRLPEAQRKTLWEMFERVRAELSARGLRTMAGVYADLAGRFQAATTRPYHHAVVDEAQDIGVGQLRFLAALVGTGPDSVFFAGDLGQRIFQQPFSWRSLGVDVRGRSRNLRINYRTSHQIRTQADRLLGKAVSDIDGESIDRTDTVSVFNGVIPTLATYPDAASESAAVAKWIGTRIAEGTAPHEIAVIVRSDAQMERARKAAELANAPQRQLDHLVATERGHVSLSTMHLAKGLEFRAVVVMACDDDVIPLASRIAELGDDADLESVYDTERHLLYVACTRARDHLLVTGVDPGSEFVEDMKQVPAG